MSKFSKIPLDTPLDPHKRTVIIGASSGIGAALALHLAREGRILALLARRKDALDQICRQINAQAGETRALAYEHDVTQYTLIPQLFQTILRDLKGIDELIYVSGAQQPVGFSEYDFEKDREAVEVNLLGAIAWMGRAATLFERMGRGQIVGITSVAADRGRVGNPAYHASKAGIDAYLESLRNRLTRVGVSVVTIKPGFVDTDTLKRNAKMTFGVISAEKAAVGIWGAMRKKKQLVYIPAWWRWFMLVIRHIPSIIFRRLSF